MAGAALILAHQGANNVFTLSTNSATWFVSPIQSRQHGSASGTIPEAAAAVTMRKAATVSKLAIQISSNTRATACTLKSRRNGADGNLTITIGAGLTGHFEDATHSDAIADGDTYCFQIDTSTGGGSLSIKYILAQIVSASGNAHNYLGSGDTPYSSSSTTQLFYAYTGDMTGVSSDADNTSRPPITAAGTLSRLQVYVSANGRGTATVITSRVNGADGNQTISVSAGATGMFEDATHSDAVAEGDRCGYTIAPGSGTGTITIRRVSMLFVGTADETPYMSTEQQSAVSGTRYGNAAQTDTSTTEADAQVTIPFAATLRRVTGRQNFGSGGGTLRSRVNGANGNGLASTGSSGAATLADTSNTDTLAAGDLFCLSWTTSNNGNVQFQGYTLLNVITPPSGAVGVRATQAGGYVLAQVISDGVRATQAGGYVLRQGETGVRCTQAGGYVLVKTLKPGCLTHDVQCWRIERTDGQVYLYTAHDQAITFRGETYEPCKSLKGSALQTSAEFAQTENIDLSGVIADDLISRVDLWSGRFDGATVEVWRVDWTAPTNAELLAAGKAGSLEMGVNEFTFEVTTASQRLQQRPILQPVMPTCRFKLGDSRCTVDLEARRVSGTVTAVESPDVRTGGPRRIFTDSARAETDRYFQLGRVTWTNGRNVGISVDVKIFSAGRFVLEQPLEYEIAVGDTYTAVPGCDRAFGTCGTKFFNAVNFGGFPHLRGSDDLQQTPGFKQ